MQLGREPALAAAQRLDTLSIPDDLDPPSAGRVLMGADDSRIHEVQVPIHLAPSIGLRLQRRQHLVPNACRTPAVEPARHRAHRTIALRQVAPGGACPMHPQHAVQNAPVILVWPPCPGLLGWQQRLQPPPLRVHQLSSSHPINMGSHTQTSAVCRHALVGAAAEPGSGWARGPARAAMRQPAVRERAAVDGALWRTLARPA